MTWNTLIWNVLKLKKKKILFGNDQLRSTIFPSRLHSREAIQRRNQIDFSSSVLQFRVRRVLEVETRNYEKECAQNIDWSAVGRQILSAVRQSNNLFVYLSITGTLDPKLRLDRDGWTVRYWVPYTATVLRILWVLKSKARGTHLK